MACEKFKQYAIVRSDSAELFEEQLNARMYELRDSMPDVQISENGQYLTAKIEYIKKQPFTRIERDPVRDGIILKCINCPHFKPTLKKDGSVDGRARVGGCEMSEYGKTYLDSDACEILYRLIQNGGARICFTDSE